MVKILHIIIRGRITFTYISDVFYYLVEHEKYKISIN